MKFSMLGWARHRQRRLIDSAKPLFLIGPARTGTTFITAALNSHPRVLLTNETAVFLQMHVNIEKSMSGVSQGILYGKTYHELWAEHLKSNSVGLIKSYYERIAALEKKQSLAYWGEKHPHLSDCLDFVSDLFPDATYIYSIRDPRDSACSIAEMSGMGLEDALLNWKMFSDSYEKFVATLPPDRLILVKYEDLARNPQHVINVVLARLGLRFCDEVGRYLARSKHVDVHNLHIKEPIDFVNKSIGRWKRGLSAADQDFARRLVGKFLVKYGYSLED